MTFNNDVNENLKLDISFRYKNEIKDSAIVNISLLSKDIYKYTDSLKINNDSIAIVIKKMQYLFSERNNKLYNSRFSAKVNLSEVEKLFKSSSWSLMIYKNGSYIQYITPKVTKKKIDKLKYEIFMLF